MNISLNENQKNIYKYYIHLLSSVINNKIPNEPPKNFNWNLICKHAQRNSVLNILSYAVSKLKNKPDVSLVKVMENDRRVAILKETSQIFETENILQKFEENSIKNLPLKGYFMKHLYPQSDYRTMTDVDIYVDYKDFKKASQIFADLGFTKENLIKKDEIHFRKDLLYVEVQSNLNDDDHTYFCNILDKAQLRDDYNYSYALNKEDFYVYMIYHLVHHFKSGGIGIRMLMDIYVFLNEYKNLDFEYINNALKELNLLEFEKQIRNLSLNWFSGDNIKINKLGEFILYCSTYGLREIHFYQSKSKQGKGFYLKQVFIPYSQMKTKYAYLKKAPVLLPFSWLQFWFTRIFVLKNLQLKDGINSRKNNISDENALFISNLMEELKIL